MRRIPRTSLAFGLSALVLTACSTATNVSLPAAVEAPARYVLHNGVRVLVQEYPSSEVVAVQLWVRAGGRDEASTELGLAHYLEHMLFKGTTTRPKGFVDWDVEAVGGRVNAGTSLDFTELQQLAPDAGNLVDRLNRLMMHGTMSDDMRTSIIAAVNAVTPSTDTLKRARQALYLVATSSQYQAQR